MSVVEWRRLRLKRGGAEFGIICPYPVTGVNNKANKEKMRTETIAATRPLKKLAVMALAAMGAFAALAYGEDTIAHVTSGATPGVWTSDFNAAKAYADANKVPLLSYWGSVKCGYCSRMRRRGINTEAFETWVKSHPIVLLCTDTTDTSTATPVKTFTKDDNRSGIFPYMRIYWPKADGTLVSVAFTGRKGKMPSRTGSTEADQLINTLNSYVGSWNPVVEQTVTFNANGGTVGETTRTVEKGKAVGTLPAATRAGYVLTGWYTAAAGGTAVTAATVVSADVTYYAQWAVPTVTATFNANGGTARETSRAVTSGAAIGALPAATRSGYTLAGWYTASTGGTLVTADTKVTGAVTYYAQWVAGDWKYTAGAAGATVSGATSASGALSIPAVLGGKSVTAIAAYAFFGNTAITSVNVPAGVKTIGEKAFKGCTSLTGVSLPAGLTTLGKAVFQNCTALGKVTVPGGVSYLTSSTFEGCTALKSVTLSSGVATVGVSAFANCTSLASVALPSSVTAVGNFAFFGCTSLASVSLPDTLATVGEKAFKNCTSLASVALPDSLATLGKAAFFNTGLVSVTVPGSVERVDDYAFQKCAALKTATLASGVKEIGKSAFANDDALETVALPASLEAVEAFAFFRCSKLGAQTLPASVATLGEKAFKYCSSMTALALPAATTAVPRELCNYCSSLETVTGGNLSSVALGAFGNCPALTSVEGLDADALALVKSGRAWSK